MAALRKLLSKTELWATRTALVHPFVLVSFLTSLKNDLIAIFSSVRFSIFEADQYRLGADCSGLSRDSAGALHPS